MGQRPGRGAPRRAGHAQGTSPALEQRYISIARNVFMATEVVGAINHMHKMRPNSASVLKSAASWYTASKRVGDSLDELKGSYISLGGYWEGRAFEAFQEYMKEDVIKVAENNEDVLFEIGNALVDVHNAVVEQYNQAVTLFGDTFARVIELHGQWEVAKAETKGAWREQLYNCIALFTENVAQRKADVDRQVKASEAAMTALRGRVQQIRAPGKVPAPVNDQKLWKLG